MLRQLILSIMLIVGLASHVWACIEWDTATGISVSASIQSATVRQAHDGSANTRTTIGIGESVNLSLDCSSFSDLDKWRANPQSNWVNEYDTLGSAAFSKQSGTLGSVSSNGLDANHVLTGGLSTTYYAAGGSIVVQAVINDSPLADDDSLVKTKSFSVIIPSGIAFVSATKMCGTSTGQNYIGGYYRRFYNVTPRNVNWQDLYIRENVPAVEWEWPDGTDDSFPAYTPGGALNAYAQFSDDHKTSPRPYSYLDGSTFSISQPGDV